jgi:hypothetical protein
LEGIQIGGISIEENQIQILNYTDQQILTHQRIHLFFHQVTLAGMEEELAGDNLEIVPLTNLNDFAFPKFLRQFIANNTALFEYK